jgi:hypothetical protein
MKGYDMSSQKLNHEKGILGKFSQLLSRKKKIDQEIEGLKSLIERLMQLYSSGALSVTTMTR